MRAALLASLALSILPSLAEAQRPRWDDLRLGAHFALGLGGDADATVGNIDSSSSLDPTLGAGVRVSVPLHEYFVAGGMFELMTFETDAPMAERESVFNFDLMLKGRYIVEIDDRMGIEPYLAVIVGPSLAIFDDPDGSGDEVWPGWNIGVLGGAAVLFDPVGFFLELGWRFHQAFTEASVPIVGDVDYQVHTHQFAMQVGAFVRL